MTRLNNSELVLGKFLGSLVQVTVMVTSGLPVLASINAGNDLENIINEKKVGQVVTTNDLTALHIKANQLLADIDVDLGFKKRCEELARDQFSASSAVKQIVKAL